MVRNSRHLPPGDLKRVIEPLASYICAADQPKAVLNLVYSALFNEVARVRPGGPRTGGRVRPRAGQPGRPPGPQVVAPATPRGRPCASS